MFWFSVLILVNYMAVGYSQNIFSAMALNPNLTKFTYWVNQYPEVLQTKDIYLTVCAFSDNAHGINQITATNAKDVLLRHMFDSTSPQESLPGLVANWKMFPSVGPVPGNQFYTKNVGGSWTILTIGTSNFCNQGRVIAADNKNGTQVYHVINSVFLDGSIYSFKNYLSQNPFLSISNLMWTTLSDAARIGSLDQSIFRPSQIVTAPTYTATVFVPTDAAWNLIDTPDRQSLLSKPDTLAQVLNRYFVTGIMFLGSRNKTFSYGFNNKNVNGSFTNVNQNGTVTTEGYSANVIQRNILLDFCVVHIIDTPLINFDTAAKYVTNTCGLFTKQMAQFGLTVLLNSNLAILALNDISIGYIQWMQASQMNAVISSCFFTSIDLTTVGTYQSFGNSSVVVRPAENLVFVDTIDSTTHRTMINTATVMVPSRGLTNGSVAIMEGVIGPVYQPCSVVLQSLRRFKYLAYIQKTNVLLGLGSPYTLFVPDDNTLTNSNIGNYSNTMIQYLLQRMIIANRAVLADLQTGKFTAATMNYAAMGETLNVELTANTLKIGLDQQFVSISTNINGYYCFSNADNKVDQSANKDRYNLIYPVNVLLQTTQDTSKKICVSAPCGRADGRKVTSVIVLCGIVVTAWVSILS